MQSRSSPPGEQPQGLAFDSAGNLFVANYGADTIVKTTPQGSSSVFASGLDAPFARAFDSAGNLYSANYGTSSIVKFAPDGTPTTFATGQTYTPGLAFDASGNLYAADNSPSVISEFTPGGSRSVFSTAITHPAGIAFGLASVPEPSSLVALSTGLDVTAAGSCWRRRRRKGRGGPARS